LPPYTIGLFIAPLHAEFGWSRGAIQSAILFSTGLGVIAAPMAGALVRRYGVRRTILPGLIGLALGLIAAASIGGQLWQFYSAYAAMSLLGAGAGGVAWNTLLTRRFAVSRGLALGIGLSGTGLCSIVMPQVAAWAIANWGWRSAYFILAAITLCLVLPLCAALLPRGNAEGSPAERLSVDLAGMDAGTAVRTGRFWLLGLSTAAIYLAVGGAIPSLVPLLTDSGVSAQQAATVMGLFGGAVIIGRIGVGALVDRYWAPAVALMVLVPAMAGCLLLAASPGLAGGAIAAVLIGVAAGTELDLLGFLVARYFGLADFARIYGRLFVFVAVAAGSAPPLFGLARDLTGSYAPAFLAAAGLLIIGASGLLALGPYPKRLDSSLL
jgi:MFS family permease